MSKIIRKYCIQIIFIGFIGLCMWACTYNNEEELYGNITSCDTAAVSYTNDVLPVLQEQCYSCHNQTLSSGGVNLQGYNQTKMVAGSGRLLGAISHAPGFSPMPQNRAKLPDCTITKIRNWIESGSPEN